jgi:hypothetical protein
MFIIPITGKMLRQEDFELILGQLTLGSFLDIKKTAHNFVTDVEMCKSAYEDNEAVIKQLYAITPPKEMWCFGSAIALIILNSQTGSTMNEVVDALKDSSSPFVLRENLAAVIQAHEMLSSALEILEKNSDFYTGGLDISLTSLFGLLSKAITEFSKTIPNELLLLAMDQ